jgi:hypothetical protein
VRIASGGRAWKSASVDAVGHQVFELFDRIAAFSILPIINCSTMTVIWEKNAAKVLK